MKNYEKYEDEVRKFKDGNFCEEFVMPHILKSNNCAYLSCSDCGRRQMLWFVEEYKEPEIDWSKVEVDTPILVKFKEDKEWKKRHFAKYENGGVYAWKNSHSSWTSLHNDDVTFWSYAKLAEDEKECKEPEIDWSNVKVDTPILVRQGKNGEWLERHFAKYENGDVYAWVDGQTSWTGADEIKWKYAKLTEGEKECEEPKVDWSKVEVDTPILVRDAKYRRWVKRYFAKYNNGTIFAWTIGCTSRDAHNMMTPWKYAKLAESEE